MRTLPATVTVLAAAMVLTGCGGENESGTSGAGQAAPARPVIVPEEELVSAEGSGDLPEATARVAQDCQGMSTTRDFDGTARRMSAVASSGDSSAGAKALAKVCLAAARANQGRYQDALDEAEEARTALESPDFAEEVSEPTARAAKKFVYRTLLYSASAVGDTGKVQEARAALEKLGGVSSQDLKNACSVAADPATLPGCASTGPSSSPATELPPDEPTTTEDESDQPPTEPVEPTGSGTDSTDGPVDTDDPAQPTEPIEPTGEGDEGESTPDDGPAPAES
ncbi:hypothetical protein ACIBI7_24265 [Nonomuraea fuscirosea]|uniref:hypothetical protein n=1 Tax=Nonomuraea fuscirosea TaxID=1291556 RepID=UPI00347E98B1